MSSISEFFSHPLVLLLIGALISGVLIPYFTNRAANYQKGLEIKTNLMGRINEGVMQMVMSVQAMEIHLDMIRFQNDEEKSIISNRKEDLDDELEEITKQLDRSQPEEITKKKLNQKRREIYEKLEGTNKLIQNAEKLFEEANNEYRQWEVSRAVIRSQIRSYFPRIERMWNDFSENVSRFYAHIQDDYSYALYGSSENRGDWGKMRQNVIKEKEKIVENIQRSSVYGLSEGLFHRFIRRITPRPFRRIVSSFY